MDFIRLAAGEEESEGESTIYDSLEVQVAVEDWTPVGQSFSFVVHQVSAKMGELSLDQSRRQGMALPDDDSVSLQQIWP